MRLVFAVACALVLSVLPARAQQSPNVEGLWAAQIERGQVAGGMLTLTRDGSLWRAELAGAEQRFEAQAGDIRFMLPNNAGGFRGALRGRAIEGYWIKPSAATDENPDQPGAMQAFATPITLTRSGANVWRGEVRPLQHRFTLYLRIFRNAEGVLVGAFRNPELNSVGGASHFRVTQDGDAVHFRARYDDATPAFGPDAAFIAGPDR